jgi:hypothetical protein
LAGGKAQDASELAETPFFPKMKQSGILEIGQIIPKQTK